MDYRLSPSLTLRAGVEGTHFSNGNTSLPNPGVNSLGARIGFVFTPGIESFADGRKKAETEDFDSKLRGIGYDLLLYGAWRKVFIADEICKHPVPGHFGVAGVNFAPMWQFNRFFRSGVSADIQYDESSNLPAHKVDGTGYDDPKFFRQPFRECLMGGLSARAEFVMPIFSVNAGIGYNLIAARCNRHTYQTLNLKMKVFGGLWLNAGYRLHSFHQPDNLVLGIGYTFR